MAGRFRRAGQQRLAGGQPVHRHGEPQHAPGRHRRVPERLPHGRDRAEEPSGCHSHAPGRLQPAPDVQGGDPVPVHLQRAARRLRRQRGKGRDDHVAVGLVPPVEDHRRHRACPRWRPATRRAASRHLRQAPPARHPPQLSRLRRRTLRSRQEAGRLPPVPRSQQGGGMHRPGRLARGRPAGRSRVAHAGQRQEPLDGVLRRQGGARARDAQSDGRDAYRPERPGRPAARGLFRVHGPAQADAPPRRKPGRPAEAADAGIRRGDLHDRRQGVPGSAGREHAAALRPSKRGGDSR